MFDWLPLSDRKGLPTPRVLLRDIDYCYAFFARRTEECCVDEELGFDQRESDYIVLSTHWGEPTGSTIAHEHRHLQQHYRFGLPLSKIAPVDLGETIESWTKGVHLYYTSRPWEMDAMCYSMKIHRDESVEVEYEAVLRFL